MPFNTVHSLKLVHITIYVFLPTVEMEFQHDSVWFKKLKLKKGGEVTWQVQSKNGLFHKQTCSLVPASNLRTLILTVWLLLNPQGFLSPHLKVECMSTYSVHPDSQCCLITGPALQCQECCDSVRQREINAERVCHAHCPESGKVCTEQHRRSCVCKSSCFSCSTVFNRETVTNANTPTHKTIHTGCDQWPAKQKWQQWID